MSTAKKEHEAAVKKVAKAYSLIGEVALFYDNPYSPSMRAIAEKAYKIQKDLHALYNEIFKLG